MPEPEILLTTSRFNVVRQWHPTPDGALHARETIIHPGAVTIVPLLPDGRVVLIRNFRPAVGRALIELPAGTLEAGEDPRHAAQRELEEETGYRPGRIEPLCQFFMSPGILRERMHLFVATELVPGPTRLDEGEQIEPLLVSGDEALAMTSDGQIEDAKTLVGLLWYQCWRKS
ncbi:MAG TPA: NUDIX hydrolase [Pirellulales bacterium]|nr:NUDIX hydrolase [Pirellulales bacterium]